MRQTQKRRAAVVLAAVMSLAATSCGSDDNTTGTAATQNISCATGSIAGAGSTFVSTIAQQWVKDYSGACPGATINYQAVGSGAGIQQFTAGTVDFGASDSALKASEKAAAEAKFGSVVQIPWAAGGIAIEYNLPGVNDLQLSGETLAGIFAGRITRWKSPEIAADNPGVNIPDLPIQVVHRSDGSGTTEAFTTYLTATAPSVWTAGSAKDVQWPVGQGAKGSDGVTAAVKAAPGAISYAELSFPRSNNLGVAKVKNASGAFVAPTGEAVSAALGEATVNADGSVKVNYTPQAAGAYPLSTVTYVMVPVKGADPVKSALTKSFIDYALNGGQQSADRLFYAPLPTALVEPAKQSLARVGA